MGYIGEVGGDLGGQKSDRFAVRSQIALLSEVRLLASFV